MRLGLDEFFSDAFLELFFGEISCVFGGVFAPETMVVGLRRNGAASPAEKQNCAACRYDKCGQRMATAHHLPQHPGSDWKRCSPMPTTLDFRSYSNPDIPGKFYLQNKKYRMV